VERKPWQGILVASALPFTADLEVDYDRFAEHVAWLAESGCEGLTPNGSLGEYQTLEADERARVVETAIAAAPPGFDVIPGVAAYGWREAVRWTEHAAGAGASASSPCRPTTTGPTNAPWSSTTGPSPQSGSRSSPTTTRSTRRSTSSPSCSDA